MPAHRAMDERAPPLCFEDNDARCVPPDQQLRSIESGSKALTTAQSMIYTIARFCKIVASFCRFRGLSPSRLASFHRFRVLRTTRLASFCRFGFGTCVELGARPPANRVVDS